MPETTHPFVFRTLSLSCEDEIFNDHRYGGDGDVRLVTDVI